MKKNQLILAIEKYIQFIPFYLLGSGCGFLVDLIIFTILRTNLGTNISVVISFLFGVLTSFFVLSTVLNHRLKKKRLGLLMQLIIGIGTLLVNIIVLNFIDYSLQLINYELYINNLDKSHYYALFSKITSSSIGFLWTSSMTAKFLFKKK